MAHVLMPGFSVDNKLAIIINSNKVIMRLTIPSDCHNMNHSSRVEQLVNNKRSSLTENKFEIIWRNKTGNKK